MKTLFVEHALAKPVGLLIIRLVNVSTLEKSKMKFQHVEDLSSTFLKTQNKLTKKNYFYLNVSPTRFSISAHKNLEQFHELEISIKFGSFFLPLDSTLLIFFPSNILLNRI